MDSHQTSILIGIGAYVVVMMLIGIYASRSSHSLDDFAVAGRKLPLWLCSVSVFATWFGSGIMMGAATAAYENDLLLMIGEPFASGLALFLIGLLFARMLRRSRRLTWPEFFQVRYGPVSSVFASIADIISGVVWLGAILFTFGVLLESLAGVPMNIGIAAGAAVVAVYTMIGGMWAVALTDFVQMAVFVIGLIVLLVVVLIDVGGWGAIHPQLPDYALRPFPVDHTIQNWVDYLHVWLAMGVAGMVGSTVAQRAFSARSEAVAQKSFFLASVTYVLIGTIPLVLGFVASVTMPGVENPNAILTDLAVLHLPPILVAVFIGAIISAGMSSCDSILLAESTIVGNNLAPLVIRNPSEALRLKIIRYSIPLMAIIGMIVAMNAERAVQVLIDSVAVVLAAVVVPFIACFWWSKANRSGALAAIISGSFTWIVASYNETGIPPDLLGFGVSLVAMITVTLLTQKSDPPRPLTDAEGAKLPLENRVF